MFLKILQNSLRIIFAGIYFLMTTSKTWTQTLDLEQEKPEPWKIWTLKYLDHKKRGKQLDAEKKIGRTHSTFLNKKWKIIVDYMLI